MDRLLIARLCRLMSIPTPRLLLTCSIPPKPAALPLPATVPRLRLSVSGVPCAQLCYRRPTFGGRGVRLLTPGALSVGSPPRRNAWTDLTPPAAATVSRDRVGLERREMRGSPRGGAVSCACESGAVRPRFFQTTTVKRPQWARPALGLIFGRDPGAAAVAGERPQQWSFAGWRVEYTILFCPIIENPHLSER